MIINIYFSPNDEDRDIVNDSSGDEEQKDDDDRIITNEDQNGQGPVIIPDENIVMEINVQENAEGSPMPIVVEKN